MASRIMHLAIAKNLRKEINIKDYNRFAFGNMAPDMSSHSDGSYSIAHMRNEIKEKQIKGIDFNGFFVKYKNDILYDELILGYFVHLLSDAIWLKNVRDVQIRNNTLEKRDTLTKQGYRELWVYNALLINHYRLKNDLCAESHITVQELSPLHLDEKIKELFKGYIRDFTTEEDAGFCFEIYPKEMVFDYINTAVSICNNEIRSMQAGQSIIASEIYYVSNT